MYCERGFCLRLFDRKSVAMKASPLLQSRGNSAFNSKNFDMKKRFNFKRTRVSSVGLLSGPELRVFIVAGEASGDVIGGRLMSSLKQLSPVRTRFAGIGGVLMSREGLESLFPMDDLTVMGFWELAPHLCRIMGRLMEATEAALEFQPHIVVTVDSKGFAFHLLKCLRDTTIITLLPGSRLQEVNCMLPIFCRTLELIKDSFHDLTAVIPVAPNRQVAEVVKKLVKKWDCPIVFVAGESVKAKYDAFDASVAGLTTSGTAVLQLQLARLPCVVAYHTNLLKTWSLLLQAKSRYIALPNILLDSEVLPESKCLACTPRQLASLIRQLIQNEHLQKQQAVAAEKVFDLLSPLHKPLDEASIIGLQTSHLLQNTSHWTPSMVAAFTILNLLRQQG